MTSSRYEVEVEVNRDSFKLHQYIYRKQILSKAPLVNIEGKSIEQIKNDYGKDMSQFVYSVACQGIDLTGIKMHETKKVDMVGFIIEESSKYLNVYIRAKCTMARNDHCILKVALNESIETKDLIKRAISSFISSHSEQAALGSKSQQQC